jgi:PKD repeat protein
MTAFGSKAKPLETSVKHMAGTPEPATVADGSTGGYVVAADETVEPFSGNGKNIMIWKVAGTASEPKLEALGAPAVSEYKLPPLIPQPGTPPDKIDPLDSRLTQATTMKDPSAEGEPQAVWTQHTVKGGGGTVVDWYELLPGTASVRQQGAISEASEFDFDGAIAPTSSGGAVISYDRGSSTSLVQLMAQSRIAGAPNGTMNTPVALAESAAADHDFSCPSQPAGKGEPSCRWGDYAGESVDPTQPGVVWGTGQVNGPVGETLSKVGHAPQWKTYNFALTASDLPPKASFTIEPNPVEEGQEVRFDAGASSDEDGTIEEYSWKFGDGEEFTSAEAHAEHTYEEPGKYTVALTVTDNGGEKDTVTHTVTVTGETPIVTTEGASAISQTAATLSGSVNPNGHAVTSCFFEYGTTTSYGSSAPCSSEPGAGTSPVGVSATIGNLTAGTTYHYRVVATSAAGTSDGADATFTTRPLELLTPPPGPEPPKATPPPTPNSSFTSSASVNPQTGAITITLSVSNAGTLSWLGTFPNGRFGAFASAKRCKKGQVRLRGRCRPAKIVFTRGHTTVSAAGAARVVLKPTRSGMKALKTALKHKRGVPVTLRLSFQSSLGGSPVSHTRIVVVKLHRKH